MWAACYPSLEFLVTDETPAKPAVISTKDAVTFGLGKNVFVAGLVSFFMDVSSEMIYSLVPLFLTSVIGVNVAVVGVIEGVAESIASLLRVFSGWLSDKLGKRKVIMAFGYGLATLSRPIMATATLWQNVFAARVVDRFGKGIRTAPRDAIIAESTPPKFLARAFSWHRAMDTFGAAVGPALAFAYLKFHNDIRAVFWLSMIPGVLAVLLIVFFISDKKPDSNSAPLPKLTLQHFGPKVRFFILIAAIFSLGNSSDAFLILKAKDVGIPVALIPIVYLVFNLVYAVSAIPAGMAADKFGKRRIILAGFLLFAVVYTGFARAQTPSAIWFLFAFYGIFMGFTEGIQKAFLATIIPPAFKATAFGVYATAVGLALLPASIVGGWLWSHVSPAATFYYGATTALFSAVLFAIFILPRTTDAPKAA